MISGSLNLPFWLKSNKIGTWEYSDVNLQISELKNRTLKRTADKMIKMVSESSRNAKMVIKLQKWLKA